MRIPRQILHNYRFGILAGLVSHPFLYHAGTKPVTVILGARDRTEGKVQHDSVLFVPACDLPNTNLAIKAVFAAGLSHRTYQCGNQLRLHAVGRHIDMSAYDPALRGLVLNICNEKDCRKWRIEKGYSDVPNCQVFKSDEFKSSYAKLVEQARQCDQRLINAFNLISAGFQVINMIEESNGKLVA